MNEMIIRGVVDSLGILAGLGIMFGVGVYIYYLIKSRFKSLHRVGKD